MCTLTRQAQSEKNTKGKKIKTFEEKTEKKKTRTGGWELTRGQ